MGFFRNIDILENRQSLYRFGKLNLEHKQLTIGKRIRLARHMSTFSRREFAERSGIKEATLRSWELDLCNISEKFINELIKYLKKEGIFCSKEWVMTGEGEMPFMLNKTRGENSRKNFFKNDLHQEIEMFLNSDKNALVYIVEDDCNEPFFKTGDIVGGIKTPLEQLKTSCDHLCIIKPTGQKETLRFLLKSEKPLLFCLSSFNAWKNCISCKIIYDTSIEFCAPICWHRRFY